MPRIQTAKDAADPAASYRGSIISGEDSGPPSPGGGPHPPAPSPVHYLSGTLDCLPRTGEGETFPRGDGRPPRAERPPPRPSPANCAGEGEFILRVQRTVERDPRRRYPALPGIPRRAGSPPPPDGSPCTPRHSPVPDLSAKADITGSLPRLQSPGTEARPFPTFALSHFRTFALSHFHTFTLSHFRTFALSHFRTFALASLRPSVNPPPPPAPAPRRARGRRRRATRPAFRGAGARRSGCPGPACSPRRCGRGGRG